MMARVARNAAALLRSNHRWIHQPLHPLARDAAHTPRVLEPNASLRRPALPPHVPGGNNFCTTPASFWTVSDFMPVYG